jgi:excinuclease UvrABC nuclease subunit
MPLTGNRYAFTKENVDNSPDQPGVYELLDGSQTIYYGSAMRSIRTRLQRHYNGDEGRCTQNATDYRREVCSNPREREAELLREYLRLYKRLPRCNDVMPGA